MAAVLLFLLLKQSGTCAYNDDFAETRVNFIKQSFLSDRSACSVVDYGNTRVVWSQLGHSVVYDQTTRSDIRPHIKVGCRPGDQNYGAYHLQGFVWICMGIWVNILTLSLYIA